MSKQEELTREFLKFHHIPFSIKENEVTIPVQGIVTIACKMSLLQDALSGIFDAVRSASARTASILDGLLAAGLKRIPGFEDHPPECTHSNVEDHGDHMHCEECGFRYPKIAENAN